MQAQAPAAQPLALPMPAAAQDPSGQDTAQVVTLHERSNLVVIDVVVTDSKHNPVHDLKQSDFTLLENNKLQHIRNFEEHSPATDTETFVPAPKLPPGLFSNRAPKPAGGPVNVLLLDYLNTPLNAQPYARKQLLQFLDKAPAGTRIAIFGMTTKLYMLQGFTTDPKVLKAALSSGAGAAQVSQILADPIGGGPVTESSVSSALSSLTEVDNVAPEVLADISRFAALESSFQQDIRAKYTLGGFQQLARYLEGIPGRKNVIWFSGSFPLNVDPNVNEQDPNDSVVRNDEELRTTDNLLTRAQVAVYPVDARGVMTDPSQDVSAEITSISASTGAQAAQSTMDFLNQTAQENETMYAMAEDTGGEAFVNSNNLTQSVEKAIENGSNYYTLTYTPSNAEWDGRFRAIKIKLADSSVKLSYRNGYFADDPNDRSRLIAGETALSRAPVSAMTTAMLHGGPDPAEILFKVRIRPASSPPDLLPLKTNRTNPDPKVAINGPYKQYGVDLVPDAHSVSCPATANGSRRCALELTTYVYNSDGQVLITANNSIRATLLPADYAKLQTTGMAFHQQISVPVKGQYYLRTAIHDLVSDRVGAVEVPVAAVARLAPLHPLPVPVAPAIAAPSTANGPAATAAPAPASPASAGETVAPK